MYPTVEDMRRHYEALDAGRLTDARRAEPRSGIGMGVSDRGFVFMRVDNARGQVALRLEHASGPQPPTPSPGAAAADHGRLRRDRAP
jgi:hypothetical protein